MNSSYQPVKKFVFFNPIAERESVAILMVINNPVVIMFNLIKASNSTVLMELIIKHTETRAVEYSTGYFEGATLIDFFNITFHTLKIIYAGCIYISVYVVYLYKIYSNFMLIHLHTECRV